MPRHEYEMVADLFAESELGDNKVQQRLSYLEIEDKFFAALAAGDRYVRYGNDVEGSVLVGDKSLWTPGAAQLVKTVLMLLLLCSEHCTNAAQLF